MEKDASCAEPQLPSSKVIVPRASGLTFSPVRPSVKYVLNMVMLRHLLCCGRGGLVACHQQLRPRESTQEGRTNLGAALLGRRIDLTGDPSGMRRAVRSGPLHS